MAFHWHVKTIADSEDNIQGESLPPSGLNLSAQLFEWGVTETL